MGSDFLFTPAKSNDRVYERQTGEEMRYSHFEKVGIRADSSLSIKKEKISAEIFSTEIILYSLFFLIYDGKV